MPINFRDKTVPTTVLYVLGALGIVLATRPAFIWLALVGMAVAAGFWIGRG